MTEDEKKKLRDGFRKPVKEKPVEQWTEDEMLAAAKRIMKRLGIEGDLCDPNGGVK